MGGNNGREERGDGDRTTGTTEVYLAFGKEAGEKGSDGVGLSEGYARLEHCKPVCEVAQAQMDWVLKDRETCRPRVC